jgi:hypothetical protein
VAVDMGQWTQYARASHTSISDQATDATYPAGPCPAVSHATVYLKEGHVRLRSANKYQRPGRRVPGAHSNRRTIYSCIREPP